MPEANVIVLHAAGVLDVDTGDVIESGYVRVEGNRITAVGSDSSDADGADEVVELPELTLIPGLMDMEVDLVLGGPGAGLNDPVRTDPVKMTLRGAANAAPHAARRIHDRAQPRAVRQDRRLPARRRAVGSDRRRLGRGLPGRSRRTCDRARPAVTSIRARSRRSPRT